MEDKFISKRELIQETQEIKYQGEVLVLKLELLTQKIKYILSKIKECDTLEEATGYFEFLEIINCLLHNLICGLGLPSDALHYFAYDFDRIDDLEVRQYIFDKIKKGEYSFGKRLDEC